MAWKHTGRLKATLQPHRAIPYARIGEDNRCETCGDIIIEKEIDEIEIDDKVTDGIQYGVVTGFPMAGWVRVYWNSTADLHHETVRVEDIKLSPEAKLLEAIFRRTN